MPVYAFDGSTYTGFNGTKDVDGQVDFTLPQGDYRFRADVGGEQFWSGETNHCTIPGCLEALVEIPGGVGEVSVTIDYIYDPLYRLTAADYSSGEFFHYAYEAVGNRLTQDTLSGINSYFYDIANRLIVVDGVPQIWDAKGNLLDDGVSTYTYDHANRLKSTVIGTETHAFAYNGLGERLSQSRGDITRDYSVDLATGLSQVLHDGTNYYLYGIGRIGEAQPGGRFYQLADGVGSIRQLLESSAEIDGVQSFEPFGKVLVS
ncbi:MAG: hypothetical protein BMS9Abin28_2147 [Anaerolineae bacterium]|nr:MAG: hypothetical protein BMS9Abin28_2147 [Anaerolineae bacterium]